MKNGHSNGTSNHPNGKTNYAKDDDADANHLSSQPLGSPNHRLIPSDPKEDNITLDTDQYPSAKRRKVGERRTPKRPPSPPWKNAGVDGPTSFIIEGRRKSSRTNGLPPETPAQLGKLPARSSSRKNTPRDKPNGSSRYEISFAIACL